VDFPFRVPIVLDEPAILEKVVRGGLLSLSDYASLLLFIWRFVWGVV
jgi:hypothetical protein